MRENKKSPFLILQLSGRNPITNLFRVNLEIYSEWFQLCYEDFLKMSAAILTAGTYHLEIVLSSVVPPSEINFCFHVLALLLLYFVLAKSDKSLVLLSNCFWTFLLDANHFQEMFRTQSFLNNSIHALISVFDEESATLTCFLIFQLSALALTSSSN